MNRIPLGVLVRAVQAMKDAQAYLNDKSLPDPYMAVLRAQAELGAHVNLILSETTTEVTA